MHKETACFFDSERLAISGPDDAASYVQHFRTLWTECFLGFLQEATPGDNIIFAPELLHAGVFYARTVRSTSGIEIEECDRWHQAIWLVEIAKQCFADAQQQMNQERPCPT